MWKKILTVLVIIGLAILVVYMASAMAVFTIALYNTAPILGHISGVLMAVTMIVVPIQMF